MKKLVLLAIVVIAVLTVAIPIGTGYWAVRLADADKIKAELAKQTKLPLETFADLPIEITEKSHSPFGAVIKAKIGDSGDGALEVVSNLSFGWFFSGGVYTIKESTVLKLSDTLITEMEQDRKAAAFAETIKNNGGVLVKHESLTTPFFASSTGTLTTIDLTEPTMGGLSITPLTIVYSLNQMSGGLKTNGQLAHIKYDDENGEGAVSVVGIKLMSDGSYKDAFASGEAYFSIDELKVSSDYEGFNVSLDNFKIAARQIAKSSKLDAQNIISFDRFNYDAEYFPLEDGLSIENFKWTIALTDFDIPIGRKLEAWFQENQMRMAGGGGFSSNASKQLVELTVELFDKGAKMSIDLSAAINKLPFAFDISFALDGTKKLDIDRLISGGSLPELLNKLIVSANVSMSRELVDLVAEIEPSAALGFMFVEGYFIENGDGTIKTSVRYENSKLLVNGKEVLGGSPF